MYRIEKVLNHNTVIAIHPDNKQECLIMGKGIGFGRKITEEIDIREEDKVYSLNEYTDRGSAKNIVKSIQPQFLEIASKVLGEAEAKFGKIDKTVLFPLADHIAFAVKRIKNGEQLSNPLTEDIRVLFHMEYKVAECIRPLLKKMYDIDIDDDEVGYVALHVHSAINDENVSQAMQMARAVRECITLVEKETRKPIDVMSLSYNRLMNHIRYMVARAMTGEKLKVNMNDYMEVKFPGSFATARTICDEIAANLKCSFEEVEIGYLAIHIERVTNDEINE